MAMPKTVPVRQFRSNLADLLDEVVDRREHVTITRHGRPAAVVIPVGEYEALEETGALERMRADQAAQWMWRAVEHELSSRLRSHPEVAALAPSLEAAVRDGTTPPTQAAARLLARFGLDV